MGNRHTYTEEFTAEAVAYARSSDQPRYEIAESLGVSDGESITKNNEAEWEEGRTSPSCSKSRRIQHGVVSKGQ